MSARIVLLNLGDRAGGGGLVHKSATKLQIKYPPASKYSLFSGNAVLELSLFALMAKYQAGHLPLSDAELQNVRTACAGATKIMLCLHGLHNDVQSGFADDSMAHTPMAAVASHTDLARFTLSFLPLRDKVYNLALIMCYGARSQNYRLDHQGMIPNMPDAANPDAVETTLRGSVLVLLQFDVAEAIRLDRLQELIRARTVQQPSLKHPAPGYVRYQRPPVVEPLETLVLESGERLQGEIKYYDYGVVSVVYELPFADGWSKLIRLASRWVWEVDFAAQATAIVRSSLERAAPALVKPYKEWLSEDYLIFHIRRSTARPPSPKLIQQHGSRIAQVVRGDTGQLAESESTRCCNRAFPTTPTTSP
jgi:hypothetical protein